MKLLIGLLTHTDSTNQPLARQCCGTLLIIYVAHEFYSSMRLSAVGTTCALTSKCYYRKGLLLLLGLCPRFGSETVQRRDRSAGGVVALEIISQIASPLV
jgi:hypothetical protein